MNGWESVLAKDFCESVRDGTHDTPKRVNQGGKPLVTSKHLKHGRVDLRDTYPISLKDFAKINERSRVDRWDVLMSMIGTVGECALVKEQPDFAIKNLAVFKMGGDELRAQWLYYYLMSPLGQGQLRANHKGVSQQFISLTQLRNLEIPLPPLPIRRRITDILSAYDDLIENNRRRIAILEETARLAYRKWFGEKEDIRATTLGEIASFVRGKVITQKSAIPGRVPVVAGGLEPAYYHNASNTGSPVITISGSGANAGFTRMYFEPIWASDCSWCDKATAKWFYFAYCFLKDNADSLRNLQQGAAQPHVYPKDINALAVALPISDTVLNRFESAVEPLFEQCGVLSKQNTALASARDMLLPRLMKDVSKGTSHGCPNN